MKMNTSMALLDFYLKKIKTKLRLAFADKVATRHSRLTTPAQTTTRDCAVICSLGYLVCFDTPQGSFFLSAVVNWTVANHGLHVEKCGPVISVDVRVRQKKQLEQTLLVLGLS